MCSARELAVGVAAIVIVDAIGEIGVLLNFAEHQARRRSCARCRRERKCVAGTHRNVLQAIFGGAVGDGAFETFAGDLRLQPDEHFRAGPRAHRVPHFGLAAAAGGLLVPRGIFVVRDEPARKACLRGK